RSEGGEQPTRRSSAPGKRTRTMSLPPRPAGAPGSVQLRRGTATAARATDAGVLPSTAGAASIDALLDAALRGVVADGAAELLYGPAPVQASPEPGTSTLDTWRAHETAVRGESPEP